MVAGITNMQVVYSSDVDCRNRLTVKLCPWENLVCLLQGSQAPCTPCCLNVPKLGVSLEQSSVLEGQPDYSELQYIDGEFGLLSRPCSLKCQGLEDSTPAQQSCICLENFTIVRKEIFFQCWSWSDDPPGQGISWVDRSMGGSRGRTCFSMLIECCVWKFLSGIG